MYLFYISLSSWQASSGKLHLHITFPDLRFREAGIFLNDGRDAPASELSDDCSCAASPVLVDVSVVQGLTKEKKNMPCHDCSARGEDGLPGPELSS